MTRGRSAARRGLRLSDLPDEVVRELGEISPETQTVATPGASARKPKPAAKAEAPAAPVKLSRRKMAAEEFAFQLRAHGFTDWVREYKFAQDDAYEARQWRFDFACVKQKLAVEIEGLVVRMFRDIASGKPTRVVTGRHATITGMREDFHKYATAAIGGWFVIRVEQDMIRNGDAIAFVERFLARRAWEEKREVRRRLRVD